MPFVSPYSRDMGSAKRLPIDTLIRVKLIKI